MRIYPFLFSLLFIFGMMVEARAQQTKLLTADKHNEYGLVYRLPLTAFEVEVEAVREVRKAGPFFNYSKQFIGTDKVVTQDEEVWTLKDVRLSPYGIPDEEKSYLMQLKAGALTFIAVDKDGMLLAVNIEPDEAVSNPPVVQKENSLVPEDNEYLRYVDEDFTSAISSYKKAEMLSDALKEVREAKLSLTRGTAETMPTDGQQLAIMLESLDRQEAALTAAFAGTVEKETMVRKFYFIPAEEGKSVLFRMSDFKGPVESDDYSGEPVYIDVQVSRLEELPVDAKGEEKKLPKDAVAYCVPGAAVISLSHKGNKIYQKEFEIAQYGYVFGLNPSIFTDKKEPSFAIFDPATGALKEIGAVKN